jgi:hypothetical protein
MDKLHTIVSKPSIRIMWQGFLRDRVWLQKRVRFAAESQSAGPTVEFGKRILDERKASCPPTILLHSRRSLHTGLEIDPTFNDCWRQR